MIHIVHLLDDFSIGGVTRSLRLFEQAELTEYAESSIVSIRPDARIADRYHADIIITHLPPTWQRIGWFYSLRLRNPHARIIHVEHSYCAGFEQHKVSGKIRFRSMIRLAMAAADQIICVSHAQRKWLIRKVGIASSKCRTIYPWSDRDNLLDLPLCRPRTIREPLKAGFYGRFAEAKNLAALVEAFTQIAPATCELHIGGCGPEEAMLRARIGAMSHIHFHGQVDDVAPFLSQVDIVIVPSLWETYGLVATEARLAGRPILVSDIDGLKEQAVRGGLAAPLSTSEEIIDAVMRIQHMPLHVMGQEARSSACNLRAESINGWLDIIRQQRKAPFFRNKSSICPPDQPALS
ncbi:MAG: glycosyltransferase family 4 protein [Sphingomonadaceae bacterium]